MKKPQFTDREKQKKKKEKRVYLYEKEDTVFE